MDQESYILPVGSICLPGWVFDVPARGVSDFRWCSPSGQVIGPLHHPPVGSICLPGWVFDVSAGGVSDFPVCRCQGGVFDGLVCHQKVLPQTLPQITRQILPQITRPDLATDHLADLDRDPFTDPATDDNSEELYLEMWKAKLTDLMNETESNKSDDDEIWQTPSTPSTSTPSTSTPAQHVPDEMEGEYYIQFQFNLFLIKIW